MPRPPPRPPPFESPESCLLLRGSSLSSGLNFQAPRMVVRGGSGICSWDLAADAGTGWGGAAGSGPGGACAYSATGTTTRMSPAKTVHDGNLEKHTACIFKSKILATTPVLHSPPGRKEFPHTEMPPTAGVAGWSFAEIAVCCSASESLPARYPNVPSADSVRCSTAGQIPRLPARRSGR